MFLLDVFFRCRFDFIVCHLSEDRDNQETKTVRNYCVPRKISLEIREITKQELLEIKVSKKNQQSWHRELRISLFSKVAEKYNTRNVVLAHHLTDHIETYLLQKQRKNIVNHFGLPFLTKLQGLFIFRPLLDFSKSDIYSYLAWHKISYFTDKSNFSVIYQRNFFRKRVEKLTIFEKYKLLTEIKTKNFERYEIRKKVNFYFSLASENEKLVLSVLKDYPLFLQKLLVVKFLVINFYEVSYGYKRKKIDEIIRIINYSNHQKSNYVLVPLRLNYSLVIEPHYCYLSKVPARKEFCFQIENPKTFKFFKWGRFLLVKKSFFSKNQEKLLVNVKRKQSLFVEEEDFPLCFRSKQKGDNILTLRWKMTVERVLFKHQITYSETINWPIITNKQQQIIAVVGLVTTPLCDKKAKNNLFMLEYHP